MRSGGTTNRSPGPDQRQRGLSTSYEGVSSDGSRVFFRTYEPLVSGDTDGTLTYTSGWEDDDRVSAGQTNGNGAFDALHGASTDGTHVFFSSESSSPGGDTDSSRRL